MIERNHDKKDGEIMANRDKINERLLSHKGRSYQKYLYSDNTKAKRVCNKLYKLKRMEGEQHDFWTPTRTPFN